MATFSKSTFNATKYAAARPHYPAALHSHVLNYASSPSSSSSPRTLVDLGCGPGLSTFPFSNHFDNIVGVDPSNNMVQAARGIQREKEDKGEIESINFRFEQGRGHELDQIIKQDESVDLVVAGQAAHWFDPLPTYRSLARILKPGGAFCFWGYGEIFFPSRPELTQLIPPYSGGLLGPYWEQPGRSIVESLLVPFPLPLPHNFPSTSSPSDHSILNSFEPSSLKRSFHLSSSSSSSSPSLSSSESSMIETSIHPLLLKKEMTLDDLEAYLRTWSSLHKYNEEHRKEEGGKDVVEELLERMRGRGWREGEKVEAAWEVGMVMGKKKM
ncbi:hypothetical protein JCM5353_001184 [Sporobolomyces roseus]